jgi:hypothetical protein
MCSQRQFSLLHVHLLWYHRVCVMRSVGDIRRAPMICTALPRSHRPRLAPGIPKFDPKGEWRCFLPLESWQSRRRTILWSIANRASWQSG